MTDRNDAQGAGLYSHRNGTADDPDVDGFYWAKYYSLLNTEVIKWGILRHDGRWQRPMLVEIVAIYGPIPQPGDAPQPASAGLDAEMLEALQYAFNTAYFDISASPHVDRIRAWLDSLQHTKPDAEARQE